MSLPCYLRAVIRNSVLDGIFIPIFIDILCA